jgi:L-lactate dehydrogenase (cytochrome)
MNYAGKDATPGFDPIHPSDILKILPPSAYIGDVDPKSIVKEAPTKGTFIDLSISSNVEDEQLNNPNSSPDNEEKAVPVGVKPGTQLKAQEKRVKPPLAHMLNLLDFEGVAKLVMKKEAWDYYSSGSDDEITLRENHAAFQRIWLRPRVMVNVDKIDMRCTLLGAPSSFPVYITGDILDYL